MNRQAFSDITRKKRIFSHALEPLNNVAHSIKVFVMRDWFSGILCSHSKPIPKRLLGLMLNLI